MRLLRGVVRAHYIRQLPLILLLNTLNGTKLCTENVKLWRFERIDLTSRAHDLGNDFHPCDVPTGFNHRRATITFDGSNRVEHYCKTSTVPLVPMTNNVANGTRQNVLLRSTKLQKLSTKYLLFKLDKKKSSFQSFENKILLQHVHDDGNLTLESYIFIVQGAA